MPFGETLAVLATLATALQTFRTSRNTSEPTSPELLTPDPIALLALDAVLSSITRQAEAHKALLHRIDAICLGSGVLLIVIAVLRFQETVPTALLIANIPIFAMIGAFSMATKYSTRVDSVGAATFQEEALLHVVERAERVEARNNGKLAMLSAVADALKVALALQVVLVATWAVIDSSP